MGWLKKKFKQVWKSKIGRAIVIAAVVIYAPQLIAKVGGKLAAAKAGTAGAAGGGTAAGTGIGSTAGAKITGQQLMSAATAAGKTTPIVGSTTPIVGSTTGAKITGQQFMDAAKAAGKTTPIKPPPGIVERLMGRAGDAGRWIGGNPELSIIGLNAAAGMMSPDEIDLMENEREYQEEERLRREENLNVAGITMNVPRYQRPIRGTGIVGQRMGG